MNPQAKHQMVTVADLEATLAPLIQANRELVRMVEDQGKEITVLKLRIRRGGK